jgi:hypothetical protein
MTLIIDDSTGTRQTNDPANRYTAVDDVYDSAYDAPNSARWGGPLYSCAPAAVADALCGAL